MRKFYKLRTFLLFLLLTLSWGMRGQEKVIFSEDFSSIKAGDNTTSSGSSTSLSSLNGFSNLTKCYSAGGAIRLGIKDAVGSITTNTLDLSGNGGKFKVSIDVKGWSSVEGQIKITPTGISSKIMAYTAVMSGSFETLVFEFEGGKNDQKIKIETTLKRAFIDNIKIYYEIENSKQVARPVFSTSSLGTADKPVELSYGTEVEVTCPTEGATISLTDLDGNELPNPVAITKILQGVKAVATKEGLDSSDEVTAYYKAVLNKPTITPDGGTVTSEDPIRIESEYEGAVIYYSINGAEWQQTSSPATLKFSEYTQLRAYAQIGEIKSAEIVKNFSVKKPFLSLVDLKNQGDNTGDVEFDLLLKDVVVTNAVAGKGYNSHIYIQDDEVGLVVYGYLDVTDFKPGTRLNGLLKGKLKDYDGLIEIISADFSKVVLTEGVPIEPIEVTLATLNAEMYTYDLRLVKIMDATMSSNMTLQQGSSSIAIFDRHSVLTEYVIPMNQITVTGYAGCYKNTKNQIWIVSTQDIELLPETKVATPVLDPTGGTRENPALIEYGTPISVSCATEGALLVITDDEGNPFESEVIITKESQCIKAQAKKEGLEDSNLIEGWYTATLAAPVFTPETNNLIEGDLITITANKDAVIYYSIDGTDYLSGKSPIQLQILKDTSIKAYAQIADLQSEEVTQDYTVAKPVYTYTFKGGEWKEDGIATLNNIPWKAEGLTLGKVYYSNDKGIQFGSANSPVLDLKLSSFGFKGIISKIKISTSGAFDIDCSFEITVGGEPFGNTISLTNANEEYSFTGTGSESGEIILHWKQSSSIAIYLKEITVEYSNIESLKVATPSFNPKGGTREEPCRIEYGSAVVVACKTVDASLLITSNDEYVETVVPITQKSQNIIASATKEGYEDSEIAEGWYSAYVAAPVFSPETSLIGVGGMVKIQTSTPGAFLHYEITNKKDGMRTVYEEEGSSVSVAINEECTITAYAYIRGNVEMKSEEVEQTYKPDPTILSGEYAIVYQHEDGNWYAMGTVLSSNKLPAIPVGVQNNEIVLFPADIDITWSFKHSFEDAYSIISQNGDLKHKKADFSYTQEDPSIDWGVTFIEDYCTISPQNTTRSISFALGNNYFACYDIAATVSKSDKLHLLKISEKAIVKKDGALTVPGNWSGTDLNGFLTDDITSVNITGSLTDAAALKCSNPNCLIYTSTDLGFTRNQVLDGECAALTLTDHKPFGTMTAFTATEAVYTRQAYQDGLWETIMLPYDVKELPADYEFVRFTGVSADKLSISFRTEEALEAHVPYLMRYVGTNKYDGQKECVFKAAQVAVTPQTAGDTFLGVYERTQTEGKYILTFYEGSVVFGKGDATSFVTPFHAYLDIDVPQNAPLRIVHQPAGETGTDRIEEEGWTLSSGGAGELIVRSDKAVCLMVTTADGRIVRRVCVEAGESRIADLLPGVYVVNGKKGVVR